MTHRIVSTRVVAALVLCLTGVPAMADSFDVRLGGRVIGQMDVTSTELSSTLDNTPLGAADGWFRATRSGPGYSALNSEGRQIDIQFDGGQAVATAVSPAGERTDLSDPAAAPSGVTDPVSGFDRLVGAVDCPEAFRMYDGRRAILVQPTARAIDGAELVCKLDYLVTHGPGHVSPFRLRTLRMEARYGLIDNRVQSLDTLRIGAGPFTVELSRR